VSLVKISDRISILRSATAANRVVELLGKDEISDVSHFGEHIAFVVAVDRKPSAIILYSAYREMRHGNDMCVTIVAEDSKWCTRKSLRYLFSYPFADGKCTRLTAIVREGNNNSIDLAKRLGFTREGVIRRGHNGKTNAIILGLLKEECRWIKEPSHG
jgi:L-amino acid N-acyltransferase YncA